MKVLRFSVGLAIALFGGRLAVACPTQTAVIQAEPIVAVQNFAVPVAVASPTTVLTPSTVLAAPIVTSAIVTPSVVVQEVVRRPVRTKVTRVRVFSR